MSFSYAWGLATYPMTRFGYFVVAFSLVHGALEAACRYREGALQLVSVSSLFGVAAAAAANTSEGAATTGRIPYSDVQFIAPGDSAEIAVEKAAKVLPRPNQTAWMRLERTFFLHFGPNTFRGVEWGDGRESPLRPPEGLGVVLIQGAGAGASVSKASRASLAVRTASSAV